MVDCNKCVNRGKVNGLSQETFCSMCVYAEQWREDFYSEGAVGGKPNLNCDGCARGLFVVDGLHVSKGKPISTCTANLYT